MTIKIYKHFILIFALITLMVSAACTDDTDISLNPIYPEDGEKVSIEIFTRSQSYQLPETRGWGAAEKNIEKTPYVLVFEVTNEKTICVEAVKAIENSATAKRYVILTKQNSGTFRFLILANNKSHFYFDESRYEWNETNLKE